MNEVFFVKIISIFGAGLLTSISPCVYPTIPITIGFLTFQSRSSNSHVPTLLFFLGQTLSYVVLGFLTVKLSEVFGFSSQSFLLNLILALLLLGMAVLSFTGFIPQTVTNGLRSVQLRVERFSSLFRIAPFFIGFGSALVASPCTSPILGSVLVSVSTDPWSLKTLAEMIAYAVGASLLVLILGLGILKAKALPRSGSWLKSVHQVTSVLILFASFYYGYRAYTLY